MSKGFRPGARVYLLGATNPNCKHLCGTVKTLGEPAPDAPNGTGPYWSFSPRERDRTIWGGEIFWNQKHMRLLDDDDPIDATPVQEELTV